MKNLFILTIASIICATVDASVRLQGFKTNSHSKTITHPWPLMHYAAADRTSYASSSPTAVRKSYRGVMMNQVFSPRAVNEITNELALTDAARGVISAARLVLQAAVNISILALLGRFVVDTTEGVDRNEDLPQRIINATEPILAPARKIVPYLFEVDASALAIIAVLTLANELFIGERGILSMLAAKR
mmetsp:Transcript_4140/g.5527  ORF Transcript_4140/g.5527 Transcript_4140/m.5527 type:complete len:189 (+) Transcript_4140:77-643(+)